MLPIDGQTQLLGILGDGITSTLSPAIHNFSAHYLQRNSVYIPLQLHTPAILADALRFLQDSNFTGVNVTTPYKQHVARLLSSDVPSVNLLYRATDNSWKATSTDGAGFWCALQHSGCERDALHTVVMLGNGGVCAALLHFWQQENLPLQKITILRRNPTHDQELARLNTSNRQLNFADFTPTQLHAALAAAPDTTLLIQTTSAPQHGDNLQRFCPALEGFHGTLVDLIYDRPSALYYEAQRRGITCQDGLPMLIEQARLGQKKWWGKAAPYTAIASHLSSLRARQQ